jgi:type I restriction enzyme S subunit
MKFRKDKWKNVKLGDVCEINPSKKEISDIPNDTLVSFAEMADLNEKKAKFHYSQVKNIKELKRGGLSYFKDFDVLLAKMTPCFENGKSGLVLNCLNGIGFGSTEFFVLRGVEINSYLLYSIISSDCFIDSGKLMMLGTTGRKRLMKEFVVNYEIPLPPLEEQKQIAALFQSIDTSIEQVDGQEKNLLTLKKQLLCDLFGEKLKFGNSLNENDFQTIKFEKITLNISERVEPQKTTLGIYVGLEHLDPENLAITRTGKPDDVIGTKLRIYKGDIIFGKRRAYQRKVSVSHFDGIASAHSMILRANEKHIEKDFLPFFMQSDVFMNRAVEISEGSLSPTIKWKTLAAQEFILPKREKQKELTEVFKQFDITGEQLRQQKITLKNLKQQLLNEILG